MSDLRHELSDLLFDLGADPAEADVFARAIIAAGWRRLPADIANAIVVQSERRTGDPATDKKIAKAIRDIWGIPEATT